MTHEEQTTRGPSLSTCVGKTATKLQDDYLGSHGDRAQAHARGVLATLRRSAGNTAMSNPLAMESVLFEMTPALSEHLVGKGDRPSPSEEAAFNAVTFFALHMQGAQQPAHIQGQSFARACGLLNMRRDSNSLKPRFDAILLAHDARARLIHIRSLIQLLRTEAIGFDYGRFATDLRSLNDPRYRNGVLIRWSRDFAQAHFNSTNSSKN
ncbi:MAG: type I-E CRISPR-associated protein Cse2/CasB [Corynebacterium pyruviciproducens]|uniref:type I-E CRISPR-associated protein Cse2/CasB n=1 Tax=Corynebacterium pyruviciproducens TaxID=598660 RepID=UPI003982EF47